MARAGDTRRRIVDAAEEVVLRDGVARLTLATAAAQAGLSKGGVLYHFPTRDALVTAMVERMVVLFDEELIAAEAGTTGPGRFVRSYVAASFAPPDGTTERYTRLGAALIAAVAAEPGLLAPLRDAFDRWQGRVDEDADGDRDASLATLARLAADGLWLSELFGLAPPAPRRRAAVAALLDGLVTGAGEPR